MKKEVEKITPDFLAEQLPDTRRKQFFDILKNEWRTLLLLGLLMALFFLPFVISLIGEAGYMNGSAEAIKSSLLLEGKSEEEIALAVAAAMRTIHNIFGAINIVCFMVFSLALSGVSYVYRCLSYGEGVILKSDFLKGIKKYWKPFLLVGFFAGLSYFLMSYTSTLWSASSVDNGAFSVLSGLTIGFFYAFLVPIFLFSLSQAVYYELPFFKSLSNSIRFTLSSYLRLIPFLLFVYAFSLLSLIVYPVFTALAFLSAIILLLPIYILAFHSFALSLFDKAINKEYYPSVYLKGLYTKIDTIEEKEKEH